MPNCKAELAPLFAAGDYQAALTRLAALREPVDTFFNEVMVMADDKPSKANRLALLNNLRNLFLQVADGSLQFRKLNGENPFGLTTS